ncbi:MAG: 3'(2'),5'-bisphosphate nucleotidase CysQ [Alphaproteobacteria bacterium]|nr:3'(2'),5'-bisphosphate nucleotidase CysQ [Alphaproteobacteria bacterium]
MTRATLTDDRLEALAPNVRAIAEDAGRVIMDIYARGFTVSEKADATPVTDADHAAEALIVPRLQALTPDIPVISEEAAALGRLPRRDGLTFWAVDPLDGTREFIARSGEFSVNIGLIRDGIPVLGVVHGPALGVSFFTTGTGRAERARAGDAGIPIASRAVPGAGLTVIGSRSHGSSCKVAAFLADKTVAERRIMGSALKFGFLADGSANLYPRFGPTSEWDTAAGHAVVRAAGGRVIAVEGGELAYGKPDYLNGGFIAWGRAP